MVKNSSRQRIFENWAFIMGSNIYLLGYSGRALSLIFNTLKDLRYGKKLVILENIKQDDDVPFECDLPYERIWHENYRAKGDDALFFSVLKPMNKSKVFDFFANRHQISRAQFINIVHPSTQIANKYDFDKGIYIEPGCIISPYAQIGFGVSINRGSSIGHHTVIEEFATINPGVHIAGLCKIGAGVNVGMGSVIFEYISVGAGSIIGGGSVVNNDIPAGGVAYCHPCKVIRLVGP